MYPINVYNESVQECTIVHMLFTWTMVLSLETASWASFTQRFTTS